MRYSYLKRSKNTGRYIIGLIAVVIIGSIVYFAAAGIVGRIMGEFIAGRILTHNIANNQPVEQTYNSGQTSSINESSQPVQKIQSSIKMPAVTVYAIQLGAFSDSNNAKEFANQIRVQQYAGYVIQDKNIYRVIAMAYDDPKLANNVIADFKSRNIESLIYSFQTKAANITISATKDNVSLISQSFSDIERWFKTLGDWSAALDRGALKGDDVVKFMEQNMIAVQQRCNGLNKLIESNKGDTTFEGLNNLYGLMVQQMNNIAGVSTDLKQLAFNIRYAYIEILDRYKQYRDKA